MPATSGTVTSFELLAPRRGANPTVEITKTRSILYVECDKSVARLEVGAMKSAARTKATKSRKPDVPPPGLDPQTVVRLVNGAGTALKLDTRESIFRQGDKSDAVFYIETGRIQVSVVSDQGKEAIIAMFGPGDFFGEGCLTAQPVRLASATAMAPSNVVRIAKEAMAGLLSEKPKFSAKFMAFLLSRNIQVEGDIVDQLFNSSEKRLARLLLLLANFNNDGALRPIVPKISQEVLASRVGTTRSRINLFMNKFRDLGLIEYNGDIKVHTALLNVIVHD